MNRALAILLLTGLMVGVPLLAWHRRHDMTGLDFLLTYAIPIATIMLGAIALGTEDD
jgi:hypothetical protein